MENEQNLFKTELNERGRSLIFRLSWIISACFWSGLLVSLGMTYFQLNDYFKYAGSETAPASFKTQVLVITIYVSVSVILGILGTFFFLVYAQRIKKAIRMDDSAGFNESFMWLLRAFWIMLANIVVNGLYLVYAYMW